MTWEESCILLTKYYGINPIEVARMTLYQVAYYVRKMGWMEGQGGASSRLTSSADVIMGGQRGQVPSRSDVRTLARRINPKIVIPEN